MDDTPVTPPPSAPRRRSARSTPAQGRPAGAPPGDTTPGDAAPVGTEHPIYDQFAATGETIRAEASLKAHEIGDEVGKLYAQAGDHARNVAEKGKARAASGLESLARVIEDAAPQVDDRIGAQYGDFARSAAQQVHSLAGTLNEKELDELIESSREFVRKSPAVALGSAAVAGFLLARLLRGKS